MATSKSGRGGSASRTGSKKTSQGGASKKGYDRDDKKGSSYGRDDKRTSSYDKKDPGYGKERSRDDKKSSSYGRDDKRGSSYDKKDSGYGKDRNRTSGKPRTGKDEYSRDDKKGSSYSRDDKRTSYDKKDSGYGKERTSGRPRIAKSKDDYKGDDKKKSLYPKKDSNYGRDAEVSSFGDKKRGGAYKKEYSSQDGHAVGKDKKRFGDDKKSFSGGKFGDRDKFKSDRGDDKGEKKPWGKPGDDEKKGRPAFRDRPFGKKNPDDFKKDKYESKERFANKRAYKHTDEPAEDETFSFADHKKKKQEFEKQRTTYDKLLKRSEKNIGKKEQEGDGTIRLNRYIANSGVCSRRDADKLIESGAVMVNGKVVTELGTKVKPSDKIQYGGQTIKTEKMVYIVLNKPKDFITTMDDPQGRKTVMSLIRGACKERVYPVGRLDRNTTGILLFTNDGELTRRLTHPKFLVSKMYHVEVDKNFVKEDLDKMRLGLELEDGFIRPDQLEYTGETKREMGIEVHSGRNRIVRRMFEHLGYDVIRLDRVQFAGLNKKDIPRGKWRFLSEKEVGFLKML